GHGIVVTVDFTERGSSRAGGRIPEYGPGQGPERGEGAAIGREGEGTDRIPFLGRLRPQDPLCSQGRDMPEPYGRADVGGGQRAAVRGEADAVDDTAVSLQDPPRQPGRRVPQGDRAIHAAGGQERPIRRERQAVKHAGVGPELPAYLPGARSPYRHG